MTITLSVFQSDEMMISCDNDACYNVEYPPLLEIPKGWTIYVPRPGRWEPYLEHLCPECSSTYRKAE